MSTISDTPIWQSRDLQAAAVAMVKTREPKILDRLQKLGLNPRDLRSKHVTAKGDVLQKNRDLRTGGDTRRRLREKLQKG